MQTALEKRVEQLEKEVAELKRQVQPNIKEVSKELYRKLQSYSRIVPDNITGNLANGIIAETITGALAPSVIVAESHGKISFNDENIFISDDMKEVSYEVARKVHYDISKVLCEYNLTIRQAARALDLAKTGIIDRHLIPKINKTT